VTTLVVQGNCGLGAESSGDIRRILGCMDDGEYVNDLSMQRVEDKVRKDVR
jgi:hypothetical protein